MSDSRTGFVRTGLYTDYGRHPLAQKQWLWSTFWATLWVNFLGILVTIALARLFRIVQRIRIAIRARDGNIGTGRTPAVVNSVPLGNNSNPQGSPTVNNQALLGSSPNPGQPFPNLSVAREQTAVEGKGWHTILRALKRTVAGPPQLPGAISSRPTRSPFSRLYWRVTWERMDLKSNLPQLISGVLYLVAYLGVVACGVLTARLATDSTAISASPDCGLYLPDEKLDRGAAFRISRLYEFDAQLDSAALAQNCYKAPEMTDDCNFFAHRSINYTVERDVPCPFQGGICYNDPKGAIAFHTGTVNARIIGINAPKTYEFRRNTTCSPLKMNQGFIRYSQHGDEVTYNYYYGSFTPLVGPDNDWCYQTRSSGYMPDASGYLLGGLFTIGGERGKHDAWTPIPQLRPPPGSSLSILFVTVQKTLYPTRREDPIFPADRPHHIEGLPNTYYINSLGHATVMACMDRTEWRDPEDGDTWFSMDDLPPSVAEDGQTFAGFWLLRYSLVNSNIFQSIDMQLSSALEAQSRVSNFVSLDMPENQWEIEAERFVKYSLARIQINARNIARGIPAKYAGWYKKPNNATICMDNYLFQTQGWTNVNTIVSLMVLIPCVVLLIVGVPSGEEELWPERPLNALLRSTAATVAFNTLSNMKEKFAAAVMTFLSTVFNKDTWAAIWEKMEAVVLAVASSAT